MKKGVIFLLVILFFSANVSAAYTKGNLSYSIDTSYSPGESIRGWINISLQQEPADSLISSSFPGSINLIDFLQNNGFVQDEDYTCIPSNCNNGYSASNPQSTKIFQLNYGQEKTIVLNLSGKVGLISNLTFDIGVENFPSCISPFEFDILNDGADWNAWQASDDFSCVYGDGMGCFNASETLTEVNIVDKFCEKIKLVKAGKFKLGAWVKKLGSNSAALNMQLHSLESNTPLASCTLPDASASGGEISCVISYNNTAIQDYYVCLKSSASNLYSTKKESVNPCGFFAGAGVPPSSGQTLDDYYIFAAAAKFSRIGNINFRSSSDMINDISAYLRSEYSNSCDSCPINCTKGCLVPIIFKSYGSLAVNLSNLNLACLTDSGTICSGNNFYDSNLTSARISSGFLKLDLEIANITVPVNYGNQSLSISLGNQEIFTKQVQSARVPIIKGVIPRAVAAATSSRFTADVYSSSNKSIVNFLWDFGDDSSEETSTSSVKHVYSTPGAYTLFLEVTDKDNLTASKEFTIIAGSPRDVVNATLKKYRQRINNISRQIANEPEWQRKIIESELDLENIDTSLTSLEKEFLNAISDDELIEIMTGLNDMSVPLYIKKTSSINFAVLVSSEDINLGYLGTMGAGDAENSSEEAYNNAIIGWNINNIDARVSAYSFIAYYDDFSKQIASHLSLNIRAINPDDKENYLIVNEKANFSPEQTTREFDDATGIKFPSLEDRNLEFIVASEKNPAEIGIYFSPEFKDLELIESMNVCDFDGKCEEGENWENCRSDCKPWGWAIFFLILLLFFAFVAYLILQEWYKRRYENYLFKNKNDLFNLVNFISNAISRGLNDGDIVKSLKQAGWHSEQISYAMKKVRGKKTGVPVEIKFPKKQEKEGNKNINPLGQAQQQQKLKDLKQEKAFKLPFLFRGQQEKKE